MQRDARDHRDDRAGNQRAVVDLSIRSGLEVEEGDGERVQAVFG